MVMTLLMMFCQPVMAEQAGSFIEADLTTQLVESSMSSQNSSTELPTRESAATKLVEALGYSSIAKTLENSCHFSDVETGKGAIELVYRLGLMSGTSETTFSPKAVMTKEEQEAVLQKVAEKKQQGISWQHACYAISSSSQMSEMTRFNAISFGWAALEKTAEGFEIVTDDKASDFKVPSGFTAPIDQAKAGGAECYLMIYFEDQEGMAEAFLNDPAIKQKVISQITDLMLGLTKDGQTRAFDGVTIDFEGFKASSLKMPYNAFLKELKGSLSAVGKKLNVAVQPTLYYKGYDYKGIGEVSDHVILMAHDYGASTLSEAEKNAGMTRTPLTPIASVYEALYEAKSQIADGKKIALQFSFGSLQWQSKAGVVQNSRAYTPSYDKIMSRLQMAGTKQVFDPYYQSSYAAYSENGVDNVIWYEDTKSLEAKMTLAKMLGITSVSYWRLGILPDGVMLPN